MSVGSAYNLRINATTPPSPQRPQKCPAAASPHAGVPPHTGWEPGKSTRTRVPADSPPRRAAALATRSRARAAAIVGMRTPRRLSAYARRRLAAYSRRGARRPRLMCRAATYRRMLARGAGAMEWHGLSVGACRNCWEQLRAGHAGIAVGIYAPYRRRQPARHRPSPPGLRAQRISPANKATATTVPFFVFSRTLSSLKLSCNVKSSKHHHLTIGPASGITDLGPAPPLRARSRDRSFP